MKDVAGYLLGDFVVILACAQLITLIAFRLRTKQTKTWEISPQTDLPPEASEHSGSGRIELFSKSTAFLMKNLEKSSENLEKAPRIWEVEGSGGQR